MSPHRNTSPLSDRLASLGLSPASLLVIGLMVVSAALLALSHRPPRTGRVMWTFAQHHKSMYDPLVAQWNREREPKIDIQLLSRTALERRMLSAFMSETPVADLIEAERQPAASAFRGPIDSIGFVDLTDRLKADGLLDTVPPASFGPWTSRERIFGLPHDVHPVMLLYRADLVEAAGVDLSKVETWDDFFVAMKPLMQDTDGDGLPDRYPLAVWPTENDKLEPLILQAGGGFIDTATNRPIIASEINAKVLATVVSWAVGPDRVSEFVEDFSAAGNALKVQGRAVAYLAPDWMCNVWRNELPQMAGKLKVMPLPAWERGGRRTSVWGGTMLGISKSAPNFNELWEFAKYLYFSPEVARQLYTVGDIVTPVKSLWSDPIFDQPDTYFSGQPKGRLYINLIDQVPFRNSSPYNTTAQLRVRDASSVLLDWARTNKVFSVEGLLPKARELLASAQAQTLADIERNVFLAPAQATLSEPPALPTAEARR